MVGYTWNFSSQEAETGGSRVETWPGPHREFQASLGYELSQSDFITGIPAVTIRPGGRPHLRLLLWLNKSPFWYPNMEEKSLKLRLASWGLFWTSADLWTESLKLLSSAKGLLEDWVTGRRPVWRREINLQPRTLLFKAWLAIQWVSFFFMF